ncbi:MAG: hypothetical protein GF313_10085 [Caldithrix sp.]|nr:hypothetical protein [Caldithrix sp.]
MKFKLAIVLIILPLALMITACNEDNGNNPPNQGAGQITGISMPDSLQKPQPSQYTFGLIEATVQDPDGLNDVDSVYFFSLKPNGQYGNDGQPIRMVDNGKSFNYGKLGELYYGDKQSGDGVYSFPMLVFSSDNPDLDTKPGTYIFTFYMRDKAGNLSEANTDSIEVYE